MKVFFRRIHLYLGFAAGLFILISCLSGAILVFQTELEHLFLSKRYFVEASGRQRLPLADLQQAATKVLPKTKVSSIRVYADAKRSVEMGLTEQGGKNKGREGASRKEPGTRTAAGAPAKEGKGPAMKGGEKKTPMTTVFLDPYNGQVLGIQKSREGFFHTVLTLHRWLLGSKGSVGGYIVSTSAFIFLFILITGIVLWWPKTRNILKQRLRIKKDAGWKRMNHDLHLVLGFYSSIVLFVIALTGCIMAFEWMGSGISAVTRSPLKLPEPPRSVYSDSALTLPADQALATARAIAPEAEFYNLQLPKSREAAFTVMMLRQNPAHEFATDALYLDQYTGTVLGRLPYSDRPLGARVRSTVRPLHTGSLWGWPSRVVALLVCLMGATFPVTGTIMWWNRTRKKAKKGQGQIKARVREKEAAV